LQITKVTADTIDAIYRCTASFSIVDKPTNTTADNNINWTSSCQISDLNIAREFYVMHGLSSTDNSREMYGILIF